MAPLPNETDLLLANLNKKAIGRCCKPLVSRIIRERIPLFTFLAMWPGAVFLPVCHPAMRTIDIFGPGHTPYLF